jgi:hypothetical protein
MGAHRVWCPLRSQVPIVVGGQRRHGGQTRCLLDVPDRSPARACRSAGLSQRFAAIMHGCQSAPTAESPCDSEHQHADIHPGDAISSDDNVGLVRNLYFVDLFYSPIPMLSQGGFRLALRSRRFVVAS